jgi:hypothetical protein
MFRDNERSFETGIGSVSTLEPFRENLVQIRTAKGHVCVLFKGKGSSSDSISVEGAPVDSGERAERLPKESDSFSEIVSESAPANTWMDTGSVSRIQNMRVAG